MYRILLSLKRVYGRNYLAKVPLDERTLDELELLAEEFDEQHRPTKEYLDSVRAGVRGLTADEDKDYARSCRERYLNQHMRDLLEQLVASKKTGLDVFATETLNEIRKAQKELDLLKTPRNGTITESDIERAREYPISNLVEVDKRGFALCLNHKESTPSMYTKKNYAHCFGCGWTGDAIDVAMITLGVSFPEAVKRLTNTL